MDNIIINKVISLATEFYNKSNVSIYTLLKETGYFEMYNQINEADILNELTIHPEFIDKWFSWSENKRSSSGWYLKQNENSKYAVGYFPANRDIAQIEYSDIKEACAAFIIREIEEIRMS
jgi:sulfite reductase beta subunit-like hemoprotein